MGLMTAEIYEDPFYESMRTYASRLARLCFLKQKCEQDHPVLLTEQELVEMAKSRLQEQAAIKFGASLESKAHILASSVRGIAAKWVACSLDDEDERESVLTAIHQDDVAGLFRRPS